MNKVFVTLLILSATPAMGAGLTRGYVRSNGTYVAPHFSSAPNYNVRDNYIYRGNTNPYTSSQGNNSYKHDTTSNQFNGTPYSNGQYGHPHGGNYGNRGY